MTQSDSQCGTRHPEFRSKKTTEQDLERFRPLFEVLPEAIIVVDATGHIMLVNQQTELLFGYTRAELLGQPIERLIPQRFHQAHRRHRLRYTAAPTTRPMGTTIQIVGLRRDGTEFSVDVSLSPLPLRKRGQQTLVLATIRDMSVRQHVEHARQQVEQVRLQGALAQAQQREAQASRLVATNLIGVILAEGDRIVEANDAFLQMTGYTRADLEAGHLRWPEMTPPEYAPLNARALAEVRERGVSVPFEKEYMRKDGSRLPILIRVARIDERPERYASFVVDLSERRRLQQAVATYAAQLEATFQAMGEGIVIMDMAGKVVLVNAAEAHITGHPSVASMQRDLAYFAAIFELTHLDGRPLPLEEWPSSRVLRGETFTDWDLRARRRDTGQAWIFSFSGEPVRDATGQQVLTVVVTRDITERERLTRARAQAEARELAAWEINRRLDEFFITAAHDIRNPVSVVKGNAQIAQRRFDKVLATITSPSPAEGPLAVRSAAEVAPPTQASGDRARELAARLEAVRESLEAVEDSTDRLTRLTAQLFDVARARTGTLELELAPCDLVDLAREQVMAQRLATPERTIKEELPKDRDAILVQADADRLSQVLANYLTNALKYSPEDQPVTVGVEVIEGQALVWVRDHGPGLPLVEQGLVWEALHRVPTVHIQSRLGKETGSLGLGLHICKRIVELHPGGRVGVESEEGHGATFWFRLPLLHEPLHEEPHDTRQG